MIQELEKMLFGLGLEDDQEEILLTLAEQTHSKLDKAQQSTEELSRDLSQILNSLYMLLKKEA